MIALAHSHSRIIGKWWGSMTEKKLSVSVYIELHARSAFSFLRGSSSPEHLAFTAADLRFTGIGTLRS